MYQKLEDLSNKTVEELVALMKSLASFVSSLDLSENNLGNKTNSELTALFAALPGTVTSLNLSTNNLYLKTGPELVTLIKIIPETVTSLNLTGNHLGSKSNPELMELLAAMSESLNSLNFSFNALNAKTGGELVELIRAIPGSVTTLNLSCNFLCDLSITDLLSLMSAIPAKITSLNLSGNKLSTKPIADLEELSAALPTSVTSLNLDCMSWSTEKKTAILNALSLNVETISFDRKIISINEYLTEQLLASVSKLRAKKGVERLAFDTIEPPIEINGSRLNRFIDCLEKQNDSLAFLTCGLLLEGQIPTTSDILDNCAEYDQYMEKRTHDAISFYTKAAKDAAIKPMVEFLLRNIKATCPSQSVQNRLALYDLAPEDNFNCELNQALKNRLGVASPLLASFVFFGRSFVGSDEISMTTTFELS